MHRADTTGLLLSLTVGYNGGAFYRSRTQRVTTVLPRRGRRDEWLASNPVPLAGEPFVETDTGAWYLGDGVHTYRELVASPGPQGYAESLRQQLSA